MTSFKDYIAQDRHVFLNRMEFADMHTIDGKQMTVLVDENELIERDKAKLQGVPIEGIYKSRRLIYVSQTEMARPAQGRQLMLDNRAYRVQECTEEAGVFAIELEAIRA